MNRIAEQLLLSVTENTFPKNEDPYYDKLFHFSKKFPRVHIKTENSFIKIKQQYVEISKTIAENTLEDLLLITLFAANEQLMYAYNKIDSDIPRIQALWFSDIIDYIEKDKKNDLNIEKVMYLILNLVFMLYMIK